MRKKLIGLLAVFTCLVLLTACGGTASGEVEEIPEETRNSLYSLTESTAQSLDEVVSSGMIEDQKSNATIYAGLLSWESAKAEIGDVDFTTDADGNGLADCFTEKSITFDEDGGYIVTVGVTGSMKSADLVATYNQDVTDYKSLVTNVNYSFNELMQQAGLNTLLGMGTTFAVLILLSLIIALFGRIFTDRAKKLAEEAEKKEREEAEKQKGAGGASQGSLAGQTDEGALVAVIAAAIAAYRASEEPDVEPGAFIVRRIRRKGRR